MSTLTGTGPLVRLALRRDRVVLPVWIAVFALVAAFAAAATASLYPDAATRVEAAAAINAAPSLVALYGPLHDPTSLGALALWKLGGFGAVLVAVLAVLTVVRHTRGDESAGRRELVGSTAVGRGAALAAALAVGWGASVTLGAATALGLAAAGLPVAGSVAFGAAWAGAGVVFAAVGGVAAQLARSARAARGLAILVLGAAFVLRAAGDVTGPGWLTWLSPIGWAQETRPYAGERWWVPALSVAAALALAVVAHLLDARRDLGAGLLADRPGPGAAAAGLRSPLALAARLHRGVLAAWTVGFLLIGALLGSVASAADELLAGPRMREVLRALGGEQRLTDAFLAAEFGVLAVLASAFVVQAALRLHAEERARRVDLVLSAPVGRVRLAAGHVAAAAGGAVVLLVAAGAGAGLGHGLQTGAVGAELPRLVGAALGQLPAVWVVGGLTVALIGLAPRAAAAAWPALVAFLLIGELGPLLRLPSWVLDLSPFTHLPRWPGPVQDPVTPLLWTTVVAAALTAAGLAGWRRRDLQ